MLDVTEAIKCSFDYARNLYQAQNQKMPNLLLEEVELDEEKRYWLITIGFDSPHVIKKTDSTPSLFPKITTENDRVYKILKIDANDGKFISMKIRE